MPLEVMLSARNMAVFFDRLEGRTSLTERARRLGLTTTRVQQIEAATRRVLTKNISATHVRNLCVFHAIRDCAERSAEVLSPTA